MYKRIAIIITLILALALGILLWSTISEEQKQNEIQNEMDDATRPLLVKKQEIKQQIEDLDKKYEVIEAPKATMQVVFTGLEADVYNICYPIMKKFGYTGILAISLTQLPGMDGCMSLEQFKEMIADGWEICIKWDADKAVKSWWPQLQKQIEQLGFKSCPVVYFTTGTYKSSLDAQLTDMGFTVVVHHGEDNKPLIQTEYEEGLWHLGSVGLMGEKPYARFQEAIYQIGNITYLVGFELEDEMYNEGAFLSMLSYFDGHTANQELIVSSDMKEVRQDYLEQSEAYQQARKAEYEQARAILEAELAEVEAEISKVEVK